MKYFSKQQFSLLAFWLVDQMTKTYVGRPGELGADMGMTAVRVQTLQANDYMRNHIQNRTSVKSEQQDVFIKSLIAKLEAEALNKDRDIQSQENTRDFDEFMTTQYSCIRLMIDHDPEGIIDEAAKEAKISGTQFPQKTWIFIKPNKIDVHIKRQGEVIKLQVENLYELREIAASSSASSSNSSTSSLVGYSAVPAFAAPPAFIAPPRTNPEADISSDEIPNEPTQQNEARL